MPTTIYDSSLITKRLRSKVESTSFISRIQNVTNPNTGYAPALGIYDQSIINTVINGQMKEFRKNDGGCTTVDIGCPCSFPSTLPDAVIEEIAGWATSMYSQTGFARSVAVDHEGNVYVTGTYFGAPMTINSFSSVSGENIVVNPFGNLSNSGLYDCFIIKYNPSGTALWATSIGGPGFNDRGYGIAVDISGNVYVTGSFSSNPITINNFSSISGGTILVNLYGTLSRSGSSDCFIVKYNTNGSAEWATRVGGTSTDIGYSIAVDSSGNVYVTGSYSVGLTLNSFGSLSGGTINVTTFGIMGGSGNTDCFIVKYDTNGIALWGTSVADSGFEQGLGVSVDSSGNVYITGSYNSNPTIIYEYVGLFGLNIVENPYGNLSNSGGQDCFIVKYNTNGKVQWATSIGGATQVQGNGIAVDTSGNVYVTGLYDSVPVTINSFDSLSGSNILVNSFGILANSGSFDCFIVKYNSIGIAVWATSIGGTDEDQGTSIDIDSSGNVYVTGFYGSNPVTINSFTSISGPNVDVTPYGNLANSGIFDCFIVKYNTNGIVQWATSISGADDDKGFGIAVDVSGNVYATGTYSSNPLSINNFSSVSGSNINVVPYGNLAYSGDGINFFIVKYKTDGTI